MGPKRSGRVIGAVVKTRRKVLQETVEVSVVERDSHNQTEDAVYDEESVRTVSVKEKSQTVHSSKESEPKKPTGSTSGVTERKEGTQKKEGEAHERAKKRKRRGGGEGYKRYVFRVLKQVHPGMAISGQAMLILNNLMNDMFERLADEASKLSKYTGGVTLSSREIQGAVRLVFPGELGRHAVAEGTKAVARYVSNKDGSSKP